MRLKKDDEIRLFWRSVSQLSHIQKYVREYFCELLGSIIMLGLGYVASLAILRDRRDT